MTVSSVVLESGNASGAFLQTPTPTLDKIPGPMDARLLSIVGLGSQHPHWIKIDFPEKPPERGVYQGLINRTPSRKVLEPHFLRLGLPELFLTAACGGSAQVHAEPQDSRGIHLTSCWACHSWSKYGFSHPLLHYHPPPPPPKIRAVNCKLCWEYWRYAATSFGSKTSIVFMQFHLPHLFGFLSMCHVQLSNFGGELYIYIYIYICIWRQGRLLPTF